MKWIVTQTRREAWYKIECPRVWSLFNVVELFLANELLVTVWRIRFQFVLYYYWHVDHILDFSLENMNIYSVSCSVDTTVTSDRVYAVVSWLELAESLSLSIFLALPPPSLLLLVFREEDGKFEDSTNAFCYCCFCHFT